jgi:hypothetical protein
MKINEHLEKAKAFERSLGKLDPMADTELFVVFLMRACTNRLNAAMHAFGITTESLPGSRQIGDLNHTYKPKLDTAPPDELRTVFERLSYIENLRADFVRGPQLLTAADIVECRTAHTEIVARTDRIFERMGRAA